MNKKYIFNLREKRLPASIGNKARNLRLLQDKGFLTPTTYVCTWQAYDGYLKNNIEMLASLENELNQIIAPNIPYAVRSSANLEDDFEHSFAGQFKTILDVYGVSDILRAIWSVWATTQSNEVQIYIQKHNKGQKELHMAVIIQEMVSPVLSGVAFSKHPITGMDETVIEVVKGRGDALVQGGITPYTYINKWGVWIAKPEHNEIDLTLMQELVDKIRRISKVFCKDVDLEWVYDGRQIYWVQMREITSTRNVPVYSNSIAKEMMPGMIKPLVWSLNVPLVCGAWKILITEMIGKNDIDVMSLAKPFYYRAYFNMQILGQVFNSLGLPQEVLEMMSCSSNSHYTGEDPAC
ncbi:MAG: PEP/pyruvate-binding domain-containing protein [Anaerolineales bacterium]